MRKKRKGIRARKDLSYKPKGVAKKKEKAKRIVAPKVRNCNTLSEGQFWQFIRSTLRAKTRFWLPRLGALKKARRPSQSSNRRLKWEFQCFICKNWFPQTSCEVHHSQPAGKLNSAADLPGFVERLFSETGWVCTCKECHKKEHKK